ncbi:hypothetical protein, partial [Salmonella sp. s58408]|uniref:hypothetical protein n=1 Tax=Salmonella sp. s58408 TaxID=3159701 RepID=UPI0039818B57
GYCAALLFKEFERGRFVHRVNLDELQALNPHGICSYEERLCISLFFWRLHHVERLTFFLGPAIVFSFGVSLYFSTAGGLVDTGLGDLRSVCGASSLPYNISALHMNEPGAHADFSLDEVLSE